MHSLLGQDSSVAACPAGLGKDCAPSPTGAMPQLSCSRCSVEAINLLPPLPTSSSFLPLPACVKIGYMGQGHVRPRVAQGGMWHPWAPASHLMGAGTTTASTWPPPAQTGPQGARVPRSPPHPHAAGAPVCVCLSICAYAHICLCLYM